MQVYATVIVKFATHYNATAHHLLAEKGYAPKLYACHSMDDGNGLFMVVTEFVSGIHGEAAVQESGKEYLPSEHHAAIRSALEALHSNVFVFADLRLPNVMIRQP